MKRTVCSGFLIAGVLCVLPAVGHVALEQYLQQRVSAVVSPKNIDLTIEFTFTSAASLAERLAMDKDQNGKLSKDERRAYLDAIARKVEDAVTMAVDGVECAVIPLYDPELDLLGSRDLEEHPHTVRLYFFTRTPASFRKGSTILVDNALWADVPVLVAVTVKGAGGIRVVASQTQGLKHPSASSQTLRVLDAMCTERKEPNSKLGG
ncbi:MAG: hypothetical protein IT365_26085 [Candidatus Hydrogenedentes bacterium]|nr:hypothetical protein [Candidatus Hydrogenedentota bacterium]